MPSPVPAPWAGNAPLDRLAPTRGHSIDHFSFPYRRIKPVFDRLKKAGVTIVEPIAVRPEFGFKSFFVQAPDGVLVEIVEAAPIPHASWEQ